MTGFVLGALATLLIALALLLRPFLRRKQASAGMSVRQMNAAVYREELARLDRDLAEGTLSAEDHAQSREELQRRALEDVRDDEPVAATRAPKKTMLALGVAIPVVALSAYVMLGNLRALDPAALQADAPANSAEVEKMVADFAAKMEKNPGDAKGWALLGRSYKVMNRPADAVKAYERAMPFIEKDPQELANYADALATLANGDLGGKPTQLLEQALKVDANNGMALWLYGTAALQRNEFDKAIATWEKLARQLPPDSEDGQAIAGAIADARERAGKPAAAVAAAAKSSAAPAGASVSGVVELTAALKAKARPDDIVMVIARPVGTRMPVAVLRARAAELPLKFTLDDSLAMSPQARLSTQGQVEVEARVSRTGQAKAEAGDLMSDVQTVKVGANGLKLQLDRVR